MKSEGLAGLTTVSVDWEEPAVIILDQTQLPNREAYLRLYTPEEIWEAWKSVRHHHAGTFMEKTAYRLNHLPPQEKNLNCIRLNSNDEQTALQQKG